jgi:hypothetical protein
MRIKINQKKLTYKDPIPLIVGVYNIYWKSGGSSVSSVGQDREGNYWFAPANWVTVPWFDWSDVKSIELIQAN